MARPRYSAAKRAREIRKQEERARKLARKHGRAAARAAAGEPEAVPAEPGFADTVSSAVQPDGGPEGPSSDASRHDS